jgi:glycerol-3-phosphate cytidylyltransferase
MIIGYTTGVFDLFHIGHLNILRNAKGLCDRLIVGVTTDELLLDYKKKKPIVPFIERCEILRSIKYVDVVVSQTTMDKLEAWQKLRFNIMFVGDDWFRTDKWNKIGKQLTELGVSIIFFPYTQGTSSTLINHILVETREGIESKKENLRKFLRDNAEGLKLSEADIGKLID